MEKYMRIRELGVPIWIANAGNKVAKLGFTKALGKLWSRKVVDVTDTWSDSVPPGRHLGNYHEGRLAKVTEAIW